MTKLLAGIAALTMLAAVTGTAGAAPRQDAGLRQAAAQDTEFSSQRRVYRRHYVRPYVRAYPYRTWGYPYAYGGYPYGYGYPYRYGYGPGVSVGVGPFGFGFGW
jgi:hypothetical protein